MTVFGLLFITLAKVLKLILDMYTFIVIGSVLISWFRPDPYNPIVNFIIQVTEPLFALIRRHMPAFLRNTGIDFTPLVVFIIITALDTFVVGLLFEIGQSLRSQGLIPNLGTAEVPLPQI